MSPESAALIRATWADLAPHADAATAAFYERVFALDPGLRPLFAHVDMAAQRRKFVETIGQMVAALDDPGVLVSESVPSGRRHAGYGVRDRDYEVVGAALLQVLAEHFGPRFTAEVRDAWRELYTLLAGVMRRAGGQVPERAARS